MDRDNQIILNKLNAIEQGISILHKKLNAIFQEHKKPLWVRFSVIQRLTDWDKYQTENARKNGYVNYKKIETGFWYDANSLSDIFKKK